MILAVGVMLNTNIISSMADTIEKTVDSCKSFFDFSVNAGQICMGF